MKKNLKTIGVLALGIIVIIVLFVFYITDGKDELIKNQDENIFVEDEVKEEEEATVEGMKVEDETIVVEIKGEIVRPAVYRVNKGTIIEDLINKAGGLTENAEISKINRAKEVKDHECISIPNKNEMAAGNSSNTNNNSSNEINSLRPELIDINTATEEELQKLTGIGPAKSKDIISYREKNGEFKNVEDIKKVKGISDGTFEKIKESITT